MFISHRLHHNRVPELHWGKVYTTALLSKTDSPQFREARATSTCLPATRTILHANTHTRQHTRFQTNYIQNTL